MFTIAWKNLARKKRKLLTAAGIGLATRVLISLFGFNHGYKKSLDWDIDSLGFKMLVVAKGCPYEAATLMLKEGTGLKSMKEEVIQQIISENEVESITPMLMQVVFDPNIGQSGGLTAFLCIDPHTYPRIKPGLSFKQGGRFTEEDAREVVMGYEAAELEQREADDFYLIPEKEVELRVVGILNCTDTRMTGPFSFLSRRCNKSSAWRASSPALASRWIKMLIWLNLKKRC